MPDNSVLQPIPEMNVHQYIWYMVLNSTYMYDYDYVGIYALHDNLSSGHRNISSIARYKQRASESKRLIACPGPVQTNSIHNS